MMGYRFSFVNGDLVCCDWETFIQLDGIAIYDLAVELRSERDSKLSSVSM